MILPFRTVQFSQRILILLSLLTLWSISNAQISIKPRQLTALDDALASSQKNFNLPSLSVAIVHEGKVIFSKSYGERMAGSGQLTTPNSLYAVASNTKAFTSAALAQLVDQGLIEWDERVQKHLPWFELYDPYVTSEMRIRDLLCHRSGLETFSGDLLWYGSKLTSKEVLVSSKHLKPTSPFRTTYGYQNLMFMAAGAVIESVTEQPWKEYIQHALLDQVGMPQSVLSTDDLETRSDVASPHNELESGEQIPIEWLNWDNMAPAGALISSAEEMARWMMVQLDSGRTATDTLWSRQRTHEMWSMHTPIPVSSWYRNRFPSMHFRGYGLGWELYTLHGRKMVAHSGGYDGMISRQVLVPEEKLGMIIMTNANSSVPWGWGHDAMGMLLAGKKESPTIEFLLERKLMEPQNRIEDEEALIASRVPQASPSFSLEKYQGLYRDQMYGDVRITQNNNRLEFDFIPTDLFIGWLEPWHYDTFRLHWGTQMMLPTGMAQFSLNMKGDVESLDFDVPNPDFDFTELHFARVVESE